VKTFAKEMPYLSRLRQLYSGAMSQAAATRLGMKFPSTTSVKNESPPSLSQTVAFPIAEVAAIFIVYEVIFYHTYYSIDKQEQHKSNNSKRCSFVCFTFQ
jgi:hypothetical protein